MRWWPLALAGLVLAGAATAAAVLPGGVGILTPTMRGSGDSMSHGPPQPGILDDGDLGNYQVGLRFEDITTMVSARAADRPQVAGDWGDVLVFRANGQATVKDGTRMVVEHRALLWLEYDPATGTFDAPELGLTGLTAVTIPQVGTWDPAANAYARQDLTLELVQQTPAGPQYPLGQHSGWVTKGDHNQAVDQDPGRDGVALSALVKPEWVEGKLVRVVDQDQVVLDAVAGAGAALVLGGAVLLGWRWARRGAAPLAMPALLRAKCEACGTPWAELPFCGRCGAERAPRTRYASLEDREAARQTAVAKRGGRS